MLPTFVIGLREGLEASLIVGIVAAFLARNGRRDLVRFALLGVLVAVLLCGAGGVALYLVSEELPQRQQEGLETVVGVVAVAMVTWMVVWMKRHSRDLKRELEGAAGSALVSGSAWALVGMAFLAVLREGFETAVFLVAAFNGSADRGTAGLGAVLGIALAIGLGYGIYRGGVRINLSRFFRVTGVVLVLVAAGLVQSAFRTAHEAGWVNFGQQSTVDLTAVVAPGSVQSALITGMLGIQPQPKLAELVAWLAYLIPVGLYVAWRPGRGLARRTVAALTAAAAVAVAAVAALLAVLAPGLPAATTSHTAPTTTTGGVTTAPVTVAFVGDDVRASALDPVTGQVGSAIVLPATDAGTATVAGVAVRVHRAALPAVTTSTTLTYDELAARNGGRLPLGIRAQGAAADTAGALPTTVTETTTVTIARSVATGQLVDVTWSAAQVLQVRGAAGTVTVAPETPATATFADAADLAATARDGAAATDARESAHASAVLLGVVAGLTLLAAAVLALADLARRRRAPAPVTADGPVAPSTVPTAPTVTR